MTRAIALLLLTAFRMYGEESQPWIDLSGPWRFTLGDDARYAAPDFDDSLWQLVKRPGFYETPLARDERDVYFWLRRTVTLPKEANGRELALTLGPIAENLEVFINGVRIGGFGDFTVSGARIGRPLTFPLPRALAPQVTIAVRAAHLHSPGMGPWRVREDYGPYLITGRPNAPVDAGINHIGRKRLAESRSLAMGSVLAALGLILLLLYLNGRARLDLLWLSLYALFSAFRLFEVVLYITPDMNPWRWMIPMGRPQMAVLIEYMLVAFRFPRPWWIRMVVWPLMLVQPLTNFEQQLRTVELMQLLGGGLLLWAVSTCQRRAGWANGLLAGTCTLWVTSLPANFGRYTIFGRVAEQIDTSYHEVAIGLFVMANVLLVTRRAVADGIEKQRLHGDLLAARTMQSLLLKPTGSEQVEAAYEPAQEVGGDFWYASATASGAQVVAVGDVSGKGLKAAMAVALTVGALRNRHSDEPASILQELNLVVAGSLDGGFVTAVVARYEPDGRLIIASAGHPAPYLHGHEIELPMGLPLGLDTDATYEQSEMLLAPGQQLTLLSDGVLEAANSKGELFGFERTLAISGKPAREILAAAKAWGQNDDITVVTVRPRSSAPDVHSPE